MPDASFDWSGLVSNTAGAFVGALAAFGFAIWFYRIQRRSEKAERLASELAANLLSLRTAIVASMQTLEEAVGFKRQVVLPMMAEAIHVRRIVDSRLSVEQVLTAIQSQMTFFKFLDQVGFAALPSAEKLSFAFDRVPAVLSFLHRAEQSQLALNKFVVERNALTSAWAGKITTGVGSSEAAYFLTMLLSYSAAIDEAVDDALFFHQLLAEQCYYLGLELSRASRFQYYRMGEAAEAVMPSADWAPGYRDKLQTFGHPAPPRETPPPRPS